MSISTEIQNRKGARRTSEVPTEVVDLLNKGRIETVNLCEWLIVDQSLLIKNVFPHIGLDRYITPLVSELGKESNLTAVKATRIVGNKLFELCANDNALASTYESLLSYPSAEIIRCYAAYIPSLDTQLSLDEKLHRLLPVVADRHYGVREIAWMAIRPEISTHLDKSIPVLTEWTSHKDENIRRFTTEVTRPRGVWCKHIGRLKENPEQAISILENLKADPTKYVQDSVGNWLNDASKSKPDFVSALCNEWATASDSPHTARIIKKALRTIRK